MKKRCSKCGKEKDLSEFSFVFPRKNDGKLRPDCKVCVRLRAKRQRGYDGNLFFKRIAEVSRESIARNKAFIFGYFLEHPCIDCGEKDAEVLDFDHVRPGKKSDVSRMVHRGFRLWKIEREIALCEVRCANCHRRMTNRRRLQLEKID